MVIDTTALVSILTGEEKTKALAAAIAGDPKRLLCTYSLYLSAIFIEAIKGEAGGRELDLLVHKAQLNVVPLTNDHLELALIAWRKFGKTTNQEGLNISTCLSYALAKYSNEPLLYTGERPFPKSDIKLISF